MNMKVRRSATETYLLFKYMYSNEGLYVTTPKKDYKDFNETTMMTNINSTMKTMKTTMKVNMKKITFII